MNFTNKGHFGFHLVPQSPDMSFSDFTHDSNSCSYQQLFSFTHESEVTHNPQPVTSHGAWQTERQHQCLHKSHITALPTCAKGLCFSFFSSTSPSSRSAFSNLIIFYWLPLLSVGNAKKQQQQNKFSAFPRFTWTFEAKYSGSQGE